MGIVVRSRVGWLSNPVREGLERTALYTMVDGNALRGKIFLDAANGKIGLLQ
jgi:hypothetical protein